MDTLHDDHSTWDSDTEGEGQSEPPPKIQSVEDAILFLAGRCDHARSIDGRGFNRFDADRGHGLADKIPSGELLSKVERKQAEHLVKKYGKQLVEVGVDAAQLANESRPQPDVDVPQLHLDMPDGDYNLTELGNARRLVDRYGEDIRYCPELGQWLIYKDGVWVLDVERRIMVLAEKIPAEIAADANYTD